MGSSHNLHLEVIPSYLLILLLCYAIYGSTPCTGNGGANQLPPSSKQMSYRPKACTQYNRCRRGGGSAVGNSALGQGQSIPYGGSLISENGTFKLGFFVRGGSTYLGIWYNNANSGPIVWVANRDNPIPSPQQHNCSLVLGEGDGVARLFDSNNHSLWSTNSTQSNHGSALLQLLDSGNLILKDQNNRDIILWQSFENPTDTIVQDQWLYFNASVNLRSWKSPDDPAQGSYSFQRAATSDGSAGLSITKNNTLLAYWESSFSLLPPDLSLFLINGNTNTSQTLRLVLNPAGIIQLWRMIDTRGQNWSLLWIAPNDQCDVRDTCGDFGVCDARNGFMCKCLPGFKPNDPDRWESNDFIGDQCLKRTGEGGETCIGDVFLSLPMIRLPPTPDSNRSTQSADECRDFCRKECSCKGYSFHVDANPDESNCQLWTRQMYNIQEEYYHPDNRTLSIRVSPSDIDYGKSACSICGTNVIPYPLSTNLTCGNPSYFNFYCNSSNGQVYFKPTPTGNSYKVSHINEAGRKFVVQLPQQGTCDTTSKIESKLLGLSNSSPYSVTNCSVVQLIGRPPVEEVELWWNPPTPPTCVTPSDCDYWPNTTCSSRVCKCAKGFHSDLQFLNCTPIVKDNGMSLGMKAGIASAFGVLLLVGILCVAFYLRKRKSTQKLGITEIKTDNDIEDIDIPFVDYESILYATDNFSDENKLGVGGFGPVYKGKLVNGNAVAIKRLSTTSAQGVEEFRNEVILIAKLQHRNLVRVLGYCIKGNEKILIYEFMPNKSLDAFLFDHNISPQLDWIKRFNIIMGIARGLLYLHQDSRLIIIHRDLKPSNILLDEELNPKISDFGLAKIVAGNEMAASTARIIGTYGYMSPEYAMDGYFSIKSDVYSFGILVLEIISGKKCASLLQFENNIISMLGYVWLLWDKGSPMELVDESVESYDSSEVKRCINVGLLCVQEDPSDRPNMSNVLMMLSGDNMNLPYPKQPVFVARRTPSETVSSSSKLEISDSNVGLTTAIEGR